MAIHMVTRAAGSVALITVVAKLLGFIREASLASVFGATSATDAYLVAQSIPFLLYNVLSYGLGTTFIPLFSHIRENRGRDASFRFAVTVFVAIVIISIPLVVMGYALMDRLIAFVAPGFTGEVRGLAVTLGRILVPMLLFSAMSGVLTGVLQAEKRFSANALLGLMEPLVAILAIIGFGSVYGIAAVALGAMIGAGLATFGRLFLVVKLMARTSIRTNWREPALIKMCRLAMPSVLISGADQVNTVVDRILASKLPSGRIAALNYANRLEQLVPGIVGSSIITVSYPTLATLAAQKRWRDYADVFVSTLGMIHFLLAPIAVGTLVLRESIVRIVFERGIFDAAATSETAWALLFLSIGMATRCMRDLVSRAFFTLQDTTTPLLIAVATIGSNILLNLLLVGPLEQGGLALGTVGAAFIGLLLSLYVLNRKLPVRLPLRRLGVSIGKTGAAACIMGGLVALIRSTRYVVLPGPLGEMVETCVLAVVGGLAYVGTTAILRSSELSTMLHTVRGVFRRIGR